MVDFDKLLGQALGSASQAATVADADLNATVSSASAAIGRLVPGAELSLTAIRQGADGILYALSILADLGGGKQGPVIEGILITPAGYPIAVGAVLDLPGVPVLMPGTRRDLADKASLEAHFAEMLSNPSSPVVQHLAFVRRKAK